MLKDDLKICHKTYVVKKSNLLIHQEAPEEEAPVQVMDIHMFSREISQAWWFLPLIEQYNHVGKLFLKIFIKM